VSPARAASTLTLLVLTAGAGPLSAGQSGPTTQPTSSPASRAIRFARGVVINWTDRQVEVDAEVIRHKAMLEVFACTPDTKEHETILRVHARAEDIFVALGLIGLVPGTHLRWNRDGGVFTPPTGDAVDIFVRPGAGGELLAAWQFMRDPRTGRSVRDRSWVFAGSYRHEYGGLAADADGVVAAVVNFPSALLALPESHTDANEELWLEPNPAELSRLPDRVTMVLRPAAVRVSLEVSGRTCLDGRPVTDARLSTLLRQKVAHDPKARVRLTAEPDVPKDRLETVLQRIADAGIEPDRLAVHRSPAAITRPDDLRPVDPTIERLVPLLRGPTTAVAADGARSVGEVVRQAASIRDQVEALGRPSTRAATAPASGNVEAGPR